MSNEVDRESIEEKNELETMIKYIRDRSQEYKLSNAEDFLEEPFEFDVEQIIELTKNLEENEEFKDIKTFKGKSALYLYSDNYLSNTYANMMFMVEEKDLLNLVANTVRNDSKAYPRPTSVKLFSHSPFKLSTEQLDEVLRQMQEKDEYMDIEQFKTSNKVLYLYSDKFMTKQHAKSLAEWTEVGRANNP